MVARGTLANSMSLLSALEARTNIHEATTFCIGKFGDRSTGKVYSIQTHSLRKVNVKGR
jgi:hypothetical protein